MTPARGPGAAPPLVRPATLADLDSLVAAHAASSAEAYAHIFPPEAPFPSDEEMAARWRPALDSGVDSVAAFAAEVEGAVVGGAIADRVGSRGFGNLRHLYVRPEEWGRGAGRALHDAVVAWCAERGLSSIDLWVLERNERARSMYERWGWQLDPDDVLVHDGLDVTELRYTASIADLLARVRAS